MGEIPGPVIERTVSAYFSESGTEGFLMRHWQTNFIKGQENPAYRLREDFFVQSRPRLGLGWNSPLFRYNHRTKQFDKYLSDVRVSGVSQPVTDSIIADVLRCGTNMQYARTFAGNLHTKLKDLASVFALRDAIAVSLYHLERQIIGHSDNVAPLLQATILFNRCGDLIEALADIVRAVEKANSDAQRSLPRSMAGWKISVQEIVVRVTEPWLAFIEGWIGLRPEESSLKRTIINGKTFLEVERHDDPTKFKTGRSRVEYSYRQEHMPSFIPVDQAQLIFESGRSLRLLKKSHPHHPIARHDVLARSGHLHLHYYEAKLRAEILRYHRGELTETTFFEPSAQDLEINNDEIVGNTFEIFDIDDKKHVSDVAMNQTTLSNDRVSDMLQKARGELGFSDAGTRFGPELASESIYHLLQ
ncbi:hypothetical protein N7466_011682 [Penicillium verhagenii]|uniref:uncharacterized protein n=1 Tax=Penicillium verhagenii TaxID=1562060 RepID=UPI0025459526|nr:uncharacterized protein N7466_011682 [Penicillium verhagenii]KAJ5915749.1 hypothetical protein N7466_011682 [Penicillium verhagenii]